MGDSYRDVYQGWQQDPMGFWKSAAEEIDWVKTPDTIFDESLGVYGRWFPDGICNTCYNCVDRHVERGRSGQAALIYDSPVTQVKTTYSYGELLKEVEATAAILIDKGVKKGDRVVIYMPMIPQTIFSMLACARIGAIHSVVFGGFASKELATRIDDAKPKAIISASCGIEPNRVVDYKPLLDKAIELAQHKPEFTLIYQRSQREAPLVEGRDFDFGALQEKAKISGRHVPCEPLAATDPLYILYTSGTTGIPKGVVRDHGGHMVALKWSMKNIYGIDPGEVFWAASDVGWVVGHSYIVYAPLLHGCTTIAFEGKPIGTPDAGVYWRIVKEYQVSALFTAPTALRAIKKEDPDGKFIDEYDFTCLKTLFLAGERADPDTILWAQDKLNRPVIDHWWQTETGWSVASNPIGIEELPIKLGSPSVAMPGYQIDVLDDTGQPVAAGELGNIVIKLPLAPGNLPTLWQNDERFKESYLSEFPGYYQTSDAGFYDDDGYVYIMARTDDIINVAGHRLSTGGMEEVVAGHAAVAECAVIGVNDPLKGQIPVGFVVLKSGVQQAESEVEAQVISLVREKIGPVAAFKSVKIVDRLPKTRSGKILRATMRKIANDETFETPATIDDPEILTEIATAFKG